MSKTNVFFATSLIKFDTVTAYFGPENHFNIYIFSEGWPFYLFQVKIFIPNC